jgi:hypothetical protein
MVKMKTSGMVFLVSGDDIVVLVKPRFALHAGS